MTQKQKTLAPQRFGILWLTGPSGAGKSTLSKALRFPCIRLDGDEMRRVWPGMGFSLEDRLENNLRVARLAVELSRQMPVVVSVIAPTEEIREKIREVCNCQFIYVRRDSLPEREGHIYNPPTSHPIVDHDVLSPQESAQCVTQLLEEGTWGALASLNHF